VVTIGLTGKQYLIDQIQGIGSNVIIAYHDARGAVGSSAQDDLTVSDMHAVEREVGGITAVSPMVEVRARILGGGGKEQDVLILGVASGYRDIRKLHMLAGRFFDDVEAQAHSKVVALTEHLAQHLFGSQEGAVGRTLKITGLPFTVIGTFREGVETFGESELAVDTVVMPYTVSRYMVPSDALDEIFFSTADLNQVPTVTAHIKDVVESRHRRKSVYRVDNLVQLISMADKTTHALTVVLLLFSIVTLIVGGVGILNIMLDTVISRTHEIGIRKAVGATAADIRLQFLAEAVLICIAGGVVGSALGLSLPLSVRFVTHHAIPISGVSVVIAMLVSSLIGVVFGTVPAIRASQMDPVESLRHE
jgi:putative ABC transport system permease protein